MAKDTDDTFNNKSFPSGESESDKSFVKKVQSRVSGFLPSSISKWFGNNESHVRQREDSDDDEEYFEIQPPSKRIKPSEMESSSRSFQTSSTSTVIHTPSTSNCFSPINRINHVEKRIGSIFPEPMAGPSGIQSRKTLTPAKCSKYRRISESQEVLNGDKYSDSGESTSGYSSMHKIGSKEQLTEASDVKSLETPSKVNTSKRSFNTSVNDRSLFSQKSPQVNSSLSSRQPSFNASMFGSPNFVDRTISSKRIMNSPFYNGRTIYGGASAYGRHLGRPSIDVRSSLRNSVQIKPINDKVSNDNAVLSKTARRILDTLEQYSTPIAEAKKIPNPSLRRSSKHIMSSPYMMRDSKVPSNKELQVPTVPDLLKMKLKERLQDSTVSVRQMATTSKSALNTIEYKIRTEEDTSKHTNKMKTKISSVRQRPIENVVVPDVKLPEVQLPISTLPKFDFSLPAPPSIKLSATAIPTKSETISTSTTTSKSTEKSTTKITQKKIQTKTSCIKEESTNTQSNKIENDKLVSNKTENCRTESSSLERIKTTEYKFADPVILAENVKSVKAINNFIFSEPVSKKQNKSFLETDVASNLKCSGNNLTLRRPTIKTNDKASSLPVLKDFFTNETVVNVLNKNETPTSLLDKFKPSPDTWECPVCLIRNVASEIKCIACKAPKLSKAQNSIGDKFKITGGEWDCKTCRTKNSSHKNKCVACETSEFDLCTPKVGSSKDFGSQFKLNADKWECNSCLVRNNVSDSKCISCSTPRVITNKISNPISMCGFGDKFKPVSNSWECGTCLIRNKNEFTKCEACQTPKPGCKLETKVPSFGNNFKKKETEWECDSCMVRNASDKLKCQCCDTPKPGTTPTLNVPKGKTTLSTFNFGIDKNSVTNVQGFTVINKTSEPSTIPASLVFGQTATATTEVAPVTFTFGIKPIQNKSEPQKDEKSNKVNAVDVAPSISNPVMNAAVVSNEKPSDAIPKLTDFVFGSTSSSSSGGIGSGFVFKEKTTTVKPTPNEDISKKPIASISMGQFTPSAGKSNNKPISLNGDINKSDSIFKTMSPAPQQNSIVTSHVYKPVISKETVPVTTSSGNLFSFGAKMVPQQSTPQQPISSMFGGNTNNPPTLFKFTPSENKPTAMNDKPLFGSPNLNTIATSTFGNSNSSVFGSPTPLPFGATAPSTFGAQTTVETKPFGFGNTNQAENAIKAPGFSFGQSAAKPEEIQKTNMFSFGNSVPPPNMPGTNIFNSVPNANQASGGGGFHFNSAPFSSLPQPAQNGAFNFGSNVANNTPKTGFNFGATQPVTGANTQGVFSFGAPSNLPSAGSGAFNFGSTEVKPNFNFTAGAPPPTFNAQPSSDKPRVIRKAVRRTQR